MPSFDGTGPSGQGPMTGRGHGFCVLTRSKENPGQVKGIAGLQGMSFAGRVNSWFRRGFGFGRGFGRGRGWGRGRGRGRFGFRR